VANNESLNWVEIVLVMESAQREFVSMVIPPSFPGFSLPETRWASMIFCTIFFPIPSGPCRLHILDNRLSELGALHLAGSLHLSGQVIGNYFLSDGAHQTLPYTLCRLSPTQVL